MDNEELLLVLEIEGLLRSNRDPCLESVVWLRISGLKMAFLQKRQRSGGVPYVNPPMLKSIRFMRQRTAQGGEH